MESELGRLVLAGLLSGGVIAALMTLVAHKYQTHTEEAIKAEFAEIRSARAWREKILATVVGPVVMHLDRTDRVSRRYRQDAAKKKPSYLDARTMRESNEAVRAILLANGHLIPEELREHSHRLIEHYDVWIRRFDEKAAAGTPAPDTPFDIQFVEPRFPRDATDAFRRVYESMRGELLGLEPQ